MLWCCRFGAIIKAFVESKKKKKTSSNLNSSYYLLDNEALLIFFICHILDYEHCLSF